MAVVSIQKLLYQAIQAAVQAGQEIRAVYETAFTVENKPDASPITQANLNANVVINQRLAATGIPIISEENKEVPYAIRKEWQRCWIVNPLDGTKEFINRNGEFAVNIALVELGMPVLGVIYAPVTGELFFADVAKGLACKASVWSLKTLECALNEALVLKPFQLTKENVVVVTSRSHRDALLEDYIGELNKEFDEVFVLTKGSSLKFCLLAEGGAQFYPRFSPTMEWDIAAGHALCKAIGMKLISIDTNQEMKYNRVNLTNGNFVVSYE